jgi:hypothetical protein
VTANLTPVPTRDQLRQHLVDSRIAGDVATPRDNNLENFGRMSRREPLYSFGLRPSGTWTYDDVLAVMAKRCGVIADPSHVAGGDTIDPDRTIDRLDAMAERLAAAAAGEQRVFIATGHPIGLRPTHTAVAAALAAAGATVLTPQLDWEHPADESLSERPGRIVYLSDTVAALANLDGTPRHTHSPLPMCAVLEHLRARGEALPDLVVADHGWSGAAGEAGIDTVGFADCNDPALFVGEAESKVISCVPLDDNVGPHLYAPLTAYLLAAAGLPLP